MNFWTPALAENSGFPHN